MSEDKAVYKITKKEAHSLYCNCTKCNKDRKTDDRIYFQ